MSDQKILKISGDQFIKNRTTMTKLILMLMINIKASKEIKISLGAKRWVIHTFLTNKENVHTLDFAVVNEHFQSNIARKNRDFNLDRFNNKNIHYLNRKFFR